MLSDAEIAHFSEVVRAQGRLAILVAQVDPDGVGAALGLAAVARHLGVEARAYYAGSFGHPQSIVLWKTFGLTERVRPIGELDPSWTVALVDSSKTVDPRFGERTIDPAVIIDHHGDLRDIGPGRFHYVEPGGSASALVAHIGSRLGVTFDRDLSTLLALGILTDTDGMTYAGTRDVDRDMLAWIMRTGDQKLVSRVSRFPMTERACSILQRLLTHRAMYHGDILLSRPPDALAATEGDYLALAADILVRHEHARLVIVLGVVGDNIRISARTREPELPLAKILVQLFGPGSGAKECSGGALLPLPDGLRVGEGQEDRFHEFLRRLEARLAELDLPAT